MNFTEYPQLTHEGVLSVVAYAAEVLRKRNLPAPCAD